MIRIYKYGEQNKEEIFARGNAVKDVSAAVSEIIACVKKNGDKAVKEYCEKFDGAKLGDLAVSEEELTEGLKAVEPEFLRILKQAAKNIERFHKKQIRKGFALRKKDGTVVGQKITPIEKVGLYVPGGTAAYPSTVLMNAIPARIAGSELIVITTPPDKNGRINPAILAAALVAGVDRIYKVGGAQAIAALAYGTESIPKVDKIVGPGNAYVAEAKKQVFGAVNIDMIAGPSEILIIADGKSEPSYIAADLLSQAEHDKMASAILITDSYELAVKVRDAVEKQLADLPRSAIARASVDDNGKIIIAESIAQAIEIANGIAPEHLELCVDQPFEYLCDVKNAGSVFLGRFSPEALGDYFAGPNHTLPTVGTARFSSPLSVDDFIKKTQFIYYTESALDKVADKIAYFAETEGLTAHAKSAKIRSKK